MNEVWWPEGADRRGVFVATEADEVRTAPHCPVFQNVREASQGFHLAASVEHQRIEQLRDACPASPTALSTRLASPLLGIAGRGALLR